MEQINSSKKLFSERLEHLISERNHYPRSIDFCFKLSGLLRNEIINLTDEESTELSIFSYGGLSRNDITPYSDVDILFVTNNPEKDKNQIGTILTQLWDRGIKVSHIVKDIKHIAEIAETDIITFCQLLELKFISGNKKTAKLFLKEINRVLNSDLNTNIIRNLLTDIEKRYSLYRYSPFLLEPNIKNGPGALRDFQSIVWLDTIIRKKVNEYDSYEPFTDIFLADLKNEGILSNKDVVVISEAYDFILKLRNEMHIISKGKTDRFDFTLQSSVAESLKHIFPGSENLPKKMMEHFFFSAEQIFNFLHRYVKKANEIIYEVNDLQAIELSDGFLLKGRFLNFSKKRNLKRREILLAYLYKSNYSAFFTETLREKIIISVKENDGLFEEDAEVISLFRELLRTSEDIGDILIHMNRTGFLEALLPEFQDLRRFFQPNAYHIYTADEHTLVAIKNLSGLKFEDSLLGDIYRRYENKEVLIMAILCHDIAKPHTLKGHELIGSQICESIMERFGYDDDEIKLASFLVENHLKMEQIAFRRNIHDTVTLNSFRENFPSLLYLDYLYLLTYADLSAVNPSSWTIWKNSLLDELYCLTNKMIRNNISAEELFEEKAASSRFKGTELNKEELFEHIQMIDDPHYLYTFNEEEISEHIREIKHGKELSVFTKEENNLTKLTIITYDKKGLLAKICGALAISDINIHDAKIFTRKDSVIIDNFRVCNFTDNKPLTAHQTEKAIDNITKSLLNKIDLEEKFREHKAKWKRLEKKMVKTQIIEVTFEEHPVYTIIDIFTSDRIGLLYLITKKIAELGLNIYFSKIGTKLNGVFDSFYVLDNEDRKVHNSRYREIRGELIKYLKESGE